MDVYWLIGISELALLYGVCLLIFYGYIEVNWIELCDKGGVKRVFFNIIYAFGEGRRGARTL